MMNYQVLVQLRKGAIARHLILLFSAGITAFEFCLCINVFAAEDSNINTNGSTRVLKNVQTTQFGNIFVTGSNQQERGGIASAANFLRVQLNKLCGDPDRKMDLPLIIKLHGAEGDEPVSQSIVT
ncbi:MAG: hypothetical protein ACPIA7_02985, partial [Akkermansiaceae bacterium]